MDQNTPSELEATELLSLLRPLVLVVDGLGKICQVHGAHGGLLGDVLGYTKEDLLGRSVLELVGSKHRLDVHGYFGPEAVQPFDPQPFCYTGQIVAANGIEHGVSVYIGGKLDESGMPIWVVTLVPSEIDASGFETLNADISGESRGSIRTRLANALSRVDNVRPCGSFFIDLVSQPVPIVVGCRSLHRFDGVAAQAVESGWHPWTENSALNGFFIYNNNDVPPVLRDALATRGWRVGGLAKVTIKKSLVGAFLFVVSPSTQDVELSGSTSLHGRVSNLVKVSGVVLQRWVEHDRLALAASTDHLTGLGNRSVLDAQAESSCEHATIVYIDVDHFKYINDTWGHQVGDEVLVIIARRLEAACRPDDTIIRLGGDEFVVVLRDVETSTAHHIGKRIENEIAAPLNLLEGPLTVSVSVGFSNAGRLHSMDDLTSLLATADSNMLRAKREGRVNSISTSANHEE